MKYTVVGVHRTSSITAAPTTPATSSGWRRRAPMPPWRRRSGPCRTGAATGRSSWRSSRAMSSMPCSPSSDRPAMESLNRVLDELTKGLSDG